MKRQLHESYRRLRQREGVTLAQLAAESDLDKATLLKFEAGRVRLIHSDIRRVFLALKSLVRKRTMRSRRRETVPGRAELRARLLTPPVSFANLGKVNQ